jgi:hypothetical protein
MTLTIFATIGIFVSAGIFAALCFVFGINGRYEE